MFYAIGLIFDDTVKVGDLAKAKSLASSLSSVVSVREIVKPDGSTRSYYVLNGVTPEIEARVYIIVARRVPKPIKDRIQATEDQDGIVLPQPVVISMDDGVDYTRAELERRLKLWVGEDGGTHIWITDINTTVTGDLLSKFIPL
jgi:hypothetical protein